MNLNNLFPFLQIFSCQRTQLEHAEEDVLLLLYKCTLYSMSTEHAEEDVLLLLHPGNPPRQSEGLINSPVVPPG